MKSVGILKALTLQQVSLVSVQSRKRQENVYKLVWW
jgi:hypothetical protein